MIISLFIIALIFFILALVLTKRNKTNFIIGILLSIAILLSSSAIYIIYSGANIINTLEFLIKNVMSYLTFFIAILFIYNGIYNSITPQRIRKNNITDLLSLLAGITLIMVNILTTIKTGKIFIVIDVVLFYIDIMFISYIIMSIIYNILTKKSEYDTLIVLGCRIN